MEAFLSNGDFLTCSSPSVYPSFTFVYWTVTHHMIVFCSLFSDVGRKAFLFKAKVKPMEANMWKVPVTSAQCVRSGNEL